MSAEPPAITLFRASLRTEMPGDHARRRLTVAFRNGILLLEGEVDSVRTKKLMLERAAGIGVVEGIVDRLRVAPRERLSDRQLSRRLGEALTGEPAFAPYAVSALPSPLDPPQTSARIAAATAGKAIRFRVEHGVVALTGQVDALDHKRLAGVLAWWVPGTRDVVNGIAVDPPEHEDEAGLAAAVTQVLIRDPALDAGGIAVAVADGAVVLDGRVPSRDQATMAENDAWLVLGVERVVNRLTSGE